MNTTTILIITACVLVMCLGIAALIMLALWPKSQQANNAGRLPIMGTKKGAEVETQTGNRTHAVMLAETRRGMSALSDALQAQQEHVGGQVHAMDVGSSFKSITNRKG